MSSIITRLFNKDCANICDELINGDLISVIEIKISHDLKREYETLTNIETCDKKDFLELKATEILLIDAISRYKENHDEDIKKEIIRLIEELI